MCQSKALSTISSVLYYLTWLMLADTEVGTVNCFVWYYFCLVKFTMSELEVPSCLWFLLFLALLENKRSHVSCKKEYLGKHFPSLSILWIHTIEVMCFTKRKTHLGPTLDSKSYCSLWSRKTWFNNNNKRILSKLLTIPTGKQQLEVSTAETIFIRQELPFLWKYMYTCMCVYIHGDEVTHT